MKLDSFAVFKPTCSHSFQVIVGKYSIVIYMHFLVFEALFHYPIGSPLSAGVNICLFELILLCSNKGPLVLFARDKYI